MLGDGLPRAGIALGPPVGHSYLDDARSAPSALDTQETGLLLGEGP